MSCLCFIPGLSWRRNFSVDRFFEALGILRSLKVLTMECFGYALYFNLKGVVIPLFSPLSRLPNLERFQLRGKLHLVRDNTYGDFAILPLFIIII